MSRRRAEEKGRQREHRQPPERGRGRNECGQENRPQEEEAQKSAQKEAADGGQKGLAQTGKACLEATESFVQIRLDYRRGAIPSAGGGVARRLPMEEALVIVQETHPGASVLAHLGTGREGPLAQQRPDPFQSYRTEYTASGAHVEGGSGAHIDSFTQSAM
jgi:hypothetical protein